jgi:ribulose-5-phosphate 4-epimerase/fuculose-1-phosphate aldolase
MEGLSEREVQSQPEKATRVQLAACYRLISMFGMTDLIYNHITAAVPGSPGHFFINAYGLDYSEITASSLFKIDLEGTVISRPDLPYDVNKAGYIIHSAVHAARHDVTCVIHTHTRAGVAVSAMKCGLSPISQTALRFTRRIGYHDFEGPATSQDERARLAANLGDNDALVLRNHGLLVCGRSIPETFHLMQRLETACRIQVDALASGVEIQFPSVESQRRTEEILGRDTSLQEVPAKGNLEWAALIRRLDKLDTSYRD